METQEQKVFDYMKKNGSISSLEMFDNFYICCPHAVIRNLRHKYNILDEWKQIERKYIDDTGKEKKKSIRFKRWFLQERNIGVTMRECFTNREKQILTLLTRGKKPEEISKELKISNGTIRNYFKIMFLKTNTNNRAQLVYETIKRGYII